MRLSSVFASGLLAVCASACVHPMPSSWRIANKVLIPPGISKPTAKQATVKVDGGTNSACPSGIRAGHGEVRFKVTPDILTSHPAGWVTAWAEGLEAQGCIAPGEAFQLATGMVQSLPLDINAGFRFLYPSNRNVIEIHPGMQLQIVDPILAEGADPDAPLVETTTSTVNGNSVIVDARFTANVVGYETSSYAAQSRNHLPGVSVSSVSAERHIKGQTERVAAPIHNYFEPLSAAPFYGLFYKAGDTRFTALIVGGGTKADLDRRTSVLENGVASCESLNDERCVAIPKRVAINPMVSVKVNGTEHLLNWGATVSDAIRAGGESRPNPLLPKLSVFKPYGSRAAPIEFDPADPSILSLILMGGETISWKSEPGL